MEHGNLSARAVVAEAVRPTPGLGLGWMRVAEALRKSVEPSAIAHIWIFAPLKRDGREWGTAVVASAMGEGRYGVFTAQYMLVTRGRRRDQGRVDVREVGEGPDEVVHDVIRGVQDRAGEGEPPIEIARDLWFQAADDEPAAET